MKTLLLLLSVVVGCASPHEYASTCSTALVGTIGSDHRNFGCDRITHNIELVKTLMLKEWTMEDGKKVQPLQSEDDWKHYFGAMNVFVSREQDLSNDPEVIGDGTNVWGLYDHLYNEATVQIDEYALCHEFFHRIDVMQWHADTIDHTGWETNGHYFICGVYEGSFADYVGGMYGEDHLVSFPDPDIKRHHYKESE